MGNKEQNNQKFSQDSKRFWDTIRQNKITIIVSNVLNREINRAPAYVRLLFATLSESQIIQIDSTTESNRLAMQYILEGVVGEKSLDDCRHIAIATIAGAGAIVCWNLKRLVGKKNTTTSIENRAIQKCSFKTLNNLWRTTTMTKFNADWYPEVIPGFDALELKEKIQAEILEKTEGMTDEEVCEYFRKGSEEFQNDIKLFRRVFDVQQESGN